MTLWLRCFKTIVSAKIRHNASWTNLYFSWLGFSDRVSLCGDARYIKLAEDVIAHEHARNEVGVTTICVHSKLMIKCSRLFIAPQHLLQISWVSHSSSFFLQVYPYVQTIIKSPSIEVLKRCSAARLCTCKRFIVRKKLCVFSNCITNKRYAPLRLCTGTSA